MKKKVLRIILIVLLMALAFASTYVITYWRDKNNNKNKNTEIMVVFDDTDYYVIPNSEVLDEEQALEEWPYKFKVTNNGNTKGLYQIIFLEDESSDIDRSNLSYILYLEENEVKKGNLDKIANNILFESEISSSKEQNYSLYIYKNNESDGKVYQYSISLNAIMDGGPGF